MRRRGSEVKPWPIGRLLPLSNMGQGREKDFSGLTEMTRRQHFSKFLMSKCSYTPPSDQSRRHGQSDDKDLASHRKSFRRRG